MKYRIRSQAICTLAAFTVVIEMNAATVGWWDLEEGVDSTTITTALESGGNTNIDGVGQGTPQYRSFAFHGGNDWIQEGLTGPIRKNNFMMAVDAINDEINIPNDPVLGTTGANESFTVEFFIYWEAEHTGTGGPVYLERRVSNTDRWEIGFNHGNANNYGKLNFYLDAKLRAGPGGNARIFVDTDSGSGIPSEYTSTTPETHGDGIQDASKRVWHHIAYVYDHTTITGTYYVDYAQANTWTAQLDIQNAGIDWGYTRLGTNTAEFFLDELRYSDTALSTDDMLRMVPVPEPATYGFIIGSLVLIFSYCRKDRK